MQIKLSPQRRNDSLSVVKQGDTLIVNNEVFDFSAVLEGATLPTDAIDSEFFSGPVERVGGELHVTLTFPHGPNPSQAIAFPQPITVSDDGEVELPQ